MNQQFPLATSAMIPLNSQVPFQTMYFPHQQMGAGNNQLYHPSYVVPNMIPTLPQTGVSQSISGIPSIIPPIMRHSTTENSMKQQQQHQQKNTTNQMNRNFKDFFASGIQMPNLQSSLSATQHSMMPSGPMIPFMKPIDNSLPPQQQQHHHLGVSQQQQQYVYPQMQIQQQQQQQQQQQYPVQQPIIQNPQQMIQPTTMLPPPGYNQNYNQGGPHIPQQYPQPLQNGNHHNYQQHQPQPVATNHYHGDPPPPALHHHNQRLPQHIKKGISKDYSHPPHRGGPGILGIGHGNPKNSRGGGGGKGHRTYRENNKPYRGGDSNGYGDRQGGYDSRNNNNNSMYPPPSMNGQQQFKNEHQQQQYTQQYQPQLDNHTVPFHNQSAPSYKQQQHQSQMRPPVGENNLGEFPQQSQSEQNNFNKPVLPSDSQNKLNVSAFHKTKMCPTIGEGQQCKKGDKCGYAHSEKELRQPPNLKKTKLCLMFEKSRCSLGDKCDFAHGSEELKNFVERYKTMLCQEFEKTGECFQGSRCQYAHGKNELRQPKFVQNQGKSSDSLTSNNGDHAASSQQQPKSAPLNQMNAFPPENKQQEMSAPYTLPLPQPPFQGYPLQSAGSSIANPTTQPQFTDSFADKFAPTPNQQNGTNQIPNNNNTMQVQQFLPQHYQAQQPYGYV